MGWIEARIKCSIESAWTTLRETLCSDIDRWRVLTRAGADSPTVSKEDHRLVISSKEKDDGGRVLSWATVEKKESYISVRRPDPCKPEAEVIIQFVPRLNEAGECRLWLGEEELEFWQASRKILEPILFG
jgi:hypothetical protein